jgi:hypothetical protein
MWNKAGVQRFANDAMHYTMKGLHAVQVGTEIAAGLKGAYAIGGQLARARATILPLLL